jgi:hypothetical protein
MSTKGAIEQVLKGRRNGMRVPDISGRAVGGKGERVVLWYCEACDHAEHDVRPA